MNNEDSKTNIDFKISFDDDKVTTDVSDSVKDKESSEDVNSNASSKDVDSSKKQKTKKSILTFSFGKKFPAKLRNSFKKFALKTFKVFKLISVFSWLKYRFKKANKSKSNKK
jgi:hypothetical protein